MASSPAPPVPFKDHCAIISNNTLYVYQPTAFQTLELSQGAQWKQQPNGVAVTGAVCVKGGTDGNSEIPALYIVGGTSNSTMPDYSGLQRYSIHDNTWTTINPVSAVTAQRVNHGATYLNASSALVVYGGSQKGDPTPTSDTWLMLMYPPYRVQAYSNQPPPPLNRAQLMPWTADTALMVGGDDNNQRVFTFFPDDGFTDLGVKLPEALPATSAAASSLVTLDDQSKILLSFDMSTSPNTVKRYVLQNPGGQPATYGQTIGEATSGATPSATSTTSRFKRDVSLSNYPSYNSTDALSFMRQNFAVASGSNDFTAIIGGDNNDTTVFFNKLSNGWVAAADVVGAQNPLTSTASPTASPTHYAIPSASTSATTTPLPAAVPHHTNGLAVLGGVLGAICGLAALLIIILVYLRARKQKREGQPASGSEEGRHEDKPSLEEAGFRPLANQGQPMGTSPVPDSSPNHGHDSMAMFNPKFNEKAMEAGNGLRMHRSISSVSGLGTNPFKRQPAPIVISKPMLPDLGDYKERPSIELGKATPLTAVVTQPSPLANTLSTVPDTVPKADQRKTDEGWAKYFTSEKPDSSNANNHNHNKIDESQKRDTQATVASAHSAYTSDSNPPSRAGGGGGFWPGSGVSQSSSRSASRSARRTLHDSAGRDLATNEVPSSSPYLTAEPQHPRTRTMSTFEGVPVKISHASVLSSEVTDDEEYEDDKMSIYSNAMQGSVRHDSWTPFDNNSGAPQAVVHEARGPLPVALDASRTDSSKSSIPTFPMPAATTTMRAAQPAAHLGPPPRLEPADYRNSEDYFGRAPNAGAPPAYVAPPSVSKPAAQGKNTLFRDPALSNLPLPPQPVAASHSIRASEDYFGRAPIKPPTADRAPVLPVPSFSNQRVADSSDMSWVNLGTPGDPDQ